MIVVENPNGTANLLDPASLSAVLNTNDDNGVILTEEDNMNSDIGLYNNNVIELEYIDNEKVLKTNRESRFVLTSDEERVFNVTDTLTVQDAYLASVKMGHFHGLEEHAYSVIPDAHASRTPERRRSSYPSPGKSSPSKSPFIKRCLSTDASGNSWTPHSRPGQDEDWDVVHGSDNEGIHIGSYMSSHLI